MGMKNLDSNPEYQKELEKLNTEIELEDEIAKVSEQLEMQELMEKAYKRGEDYGKGYSDGFTQGVRFFYEKEAIKWKARQEKYDAFNRRWGITT
jgi:hypothetical protein